MTLATASERLKGMFQTKAMGHGVELARYCVTHKLGNVTELVRIALAIIAAAYRINAHTLPLLRL